MPDRKTKSCSSSKTLAKGAEIRDLVVTHSAAGAHAAVLFLVLLSGCSLFASKWASRNERHSGIGPVKETRATLEIDNRRGSKPSNVLVILALSGGGSRAAYFAAQSMFALSNADGDKDMLKKVDAISSVSGGSITAAYYCVSRDEDEEDEEERWRPVWSSAEVTKRLTRDYIFGLKGVFISGFLLHPWDIPRTWFTGYSATTMMADVFNNQIFVDSTWSRKVFTFGDLGPNRPYLVLNAGNGTRDYQSTHKHFLGDSFTFTRDDFDNINSDIDTYPLAYGVMASAAFPGGFHYINLTDYPTEKTEKERFLHLFDGGTVDNLGLLTAKKMIVDWKRRMIEEYKSDIKTLDPLVVVVVLVDSHVSGSGADSAQPDARSIWDHIVDSDMLTTYDTLMTANRTSLIQDFTEGQWAGLDDDSVKTKIVFWHLTFDKIRFWPYQPDPGGSDEKLYKSVQRIPTWLALSDPDRLRIDDAVRLLFSKGLCLGQIKEILDVYGANARKCGPANKLRCAQVPTHDDCHRENTIENKVIIELLQSQSEVSTRNNDAQLTQLNFGRVAPGNQRSVIMKIVNNQSREISLRATLKGANPHQFEIDENSSATSCGSSLESGGSCNYSVVFRPNKTKSPTAIFMLAVDPDLDSPHKVNLSGVSY